MPGRPAEKILHITGPRVIVARIMTTRSMDNTPDNTPDRADLTAAFLRALQERRVDDALELIEAGADVTDPGTETPSRAPVIMAIEMGSVELTKAIIRAGKLDINETDSPGWTLLHSAARDDRADVAAALLDMGAQIEQAATDTGWTPLHVAALYGATKTTETLLQRNANPNARATNKDGNTPLHNAAARGRIDDIMTLLAHGADPRQTNDDNFTPRDFAVMQNQLAAAASLLRYTEQLDRADRLKRLKTLRRNGAAR